MSETPSDDDVMRRVVDVANVPPLFPTQRHDPAFWEWLGRAVATYGFLEETLGKAIFAFTGTRPYNEGELAKAMEAWLPLLERALYETLNPLIDLYAKAVREHPGATISNLDELVSDLREAAKLRNVICHGSWRSPDPAGASVPMYVARNGRRPFDTAIDIAFLKQLQRHVAELSVAVVNSVTHMGWNFPGTTGPGKDVY